MRIWLGKLIGAAILSVIITGCDSSAPQQVNEAPVSKATSPHYQSPTLAEDQRKQLSEEFSATPFSVLNISEQIYDGGPALAITFSVPIDPQLSLARYIELTKEKSEPVSGEWILSESMNIAYFPFIEPEVRYQIKVNKGLPAINGRLLDRDKQQTVRTARSQEQVRFTSTGSQLSVALSDGLSVEAINVPAVDIDFHRVNDTQLSDFLASYLGDDYYELQRLKSYSQLVFSARYDLNYTPNRRRSSLIPLKNVQALQQPGIYIAVMKGAGDYPYRYQVTWFSVSDLGFQIRSIGQQQLAFVNHTVSAKPQSNVTVRILNRKGQVLAEQQTDAQGFAEINGVSVAADSVDQRAYVALAQRDGHLSILKLQKPAMDLTEYKLASRPQQSLELFLYGPRELYRPGETVRVRGLLRDNDARLIEPQPLQVTIKRPDGRTFQSFVWQGDAQAFYEHEFSVPKNTLTGDWRFEVKLGNDDKFDYSFQVEDFLPERMKLQLTADKSVLTNRENATISLQGDYLYGAPAANNRAEATVILRQARTLSEKYQDFIFGVEDFRDFDLEKDLNPIKLNDQGAAQLTIPNLWSKTSQPLRLTTRVSLYESGGRPVSRSLDQWVWPRSQMVGVRPTWDGSIAPPESNVTLELINIDQNDELLASDQMMVTLVRENADYYWQWNDGWSYQQSMRNVPVYSKSLSTAKDQKLTLTVPVQYGNYRLEVRNQQNELLNSYRFFAGWRWDRNAEGETGRPDMVQLAWNKDAFSAGDVAKLQVTAPYNGEAIITVEADNLLWHGVQPLVDGKGTVDIPVAANWRRHDIYTTVTVIRQGEAKTKRLPKRAFGLLHLPLDRTSRRLTVALEAPEKVLPESTLATKIKVSGQTTGSVNVTLAAVDVGVLSLHRHVTPKPHQWFFTKRRYQSEIRDTWGSLIEQLSDKSARQRFGGDSDVELSRGGDAPVSDVQVVSLVSDKVELDANGEAIIELPLPYFNGELKLMAVAFSDQEFGHQDGRVTVAAPLVAEISMPRFLGFGDQSEATLDLQNMTEEQQVLTLTFSADAAIGNERLQRSITLSPKQKQVLKLPIKGMQSSGAGKVTVNIVEDNQNKSDAVNLQREWILGLRSPYAAELRQWDAVLKPNQTQELSAKLFAGLQVPGQHLIVNASDQPPFNAAEHFSRLMSYPYGCLEQTTSRVWPLLLATEAELLQYDATDNKEIAKQRSKLVGQAISRILSMQRSDGSFGLWSNQSPESHWLTAYATDFLLTAKDYGFAVDAKALESAMKRLQRYVTTSGKMWSENRHYSSDPDHYHISYRAYAAFVLARKQQLRLSDARNLYDRYAKLAKTRLPLAYLASALEMSGDVKRADQAWASALSAQKPSVQYAGDYGSVIRDQALTTVLALQSKVVKDPWALLFKLRDELRDRRWLSTQERVTLFKLAQNFNASNKQTWQMQVSFDAKPQSVETTGRWLKHFVANQIPQQTEFKSNFSKPLYLTAQVQGYPTVAPAPISDGIRVRRTFYSETGAPIDLAQVSTGDLLLVRIDVQTTDENQLPEGMLVDLLPAGLELENQNLESAVKMDEMVVGKRKVSEWMSATRLNHQEYRDDRFVAALPIYRRQDATVFYLARAVTPGTYLIPPTQVEDMYRPYIRAIGKSEGTITILPK